MKRKLYDLAAADSAFRFSPYCWRIKLALAHKNLSYDTIPWRFTDKDAIAFSGQGTVPVLVDGKTTISDSQAIAEYLEDTYPNEASLFGDPQARAVTLFVKHWAESTLHPAIAKIVLPAIFKRLAPVDQAYFRTTREASHGMTIEAIEAGRAGYLPALEAALEPLRRTLRAQDFIAGEAPAYADHIIFGALQWAAMTTAEPLWAEDDVLAVWMRAVLSAYDLD
jgi:glutathione S-transferase